MDPLFYIKYAAADLRCAKHNLKEEGDVYTRSAAFHVEQAIAKTLMQVLRTLGIPRAENEIYVHQLLSKIPTDNGLVSTWRLNELAPHLGTLEDWEERVSWDESCLVSRHDVVVFKDYARCLHREVSNNLAQRGGC